MHKHYFMTAPQMLACMAVFAGFGSLAMAQDEFHFYKLGESQITMDKAQVVARSLGLKQRSDPDGTPLPIWEAGDGSVRQTLTQGLLYVSPDLPNSKRAAPKPEVAQRLAQDYLGKYGLVPDDRSQWVPSFNFWTRQASDEKGNLSRPITPIVGVKFDRKLDGLPVFGPASALTVDIDAAGVAGGMTSVRPAIQVDDRVLIKTDDQIKGEYLQKLAIQRKLEGGSPRLVERVKCYWEEGTDYIQPIWLYKVVFTDEKGGESAVEIPVAIAKNMPAPFQKSVYSGFQPIMPANGGDGDPGGRVSNLRLGEYVVRQDADSDICLNVANAFYSLSSAFAPFTGHSVTRAQYYWDHQWLWEDALGISDNCKYYAGSVDMAAIVAHASPWQFTCLSNYGETVDLHDMNHFGYNVGGGGNPDQCYTSYLLIASCSMIPAPGDPYGGSYTSGSPFDVWWKMFWGLHGVYGFRTTAGKQAAVDAFASFGLRTGLCHPNVAAWLDSTSALSHSSNWNYGSIVIASGRENDIIYDTSARAKANSLTMWWNHG